MIYSLKEWTDSSEENLHTAKYAAEKRKLVLINGLISIHYFNSLSLKLDFSYKLPDINNIPEINSMRDHPTSI